MTSVSSRTKSPVTIPSEYLEPISLGGLEGRLMHLPSTAKRKIVFISGHHTAHERTYAIAQLLQDFGEVFAPDIPGFGGMNSLYSVDMDVTYDNFADYLYTFMKSQKLTSGITMFATSFGSQIVTRMLQKYPDAVEWIDDCIGFVGFGAGKDFNMNLPYKLGINAIIYPASTRPGAWVLQNVFFNPISMSIIMAVFSRAKAKMHSDDDNMKSNMIDMEKYLWEIGDARTHARTTISMFRDDLRNYADTPVPITFHNIITDNDQYLSSESIADTFGDIYEKYVPHTFDSHVHMPSMISGKEEIKGMIPAGIQKLLSK